MVPVVGRLALNGRRLGLSAPDQEEVWRRHEGSSSTSTYLNIVIIMLWKVNCECLEPGRWKARHPEMR